MLRWESARGRLTACFAWLFFGCASWTAIAATGTWDDGFRDPSTLSSSVPTGDAEFGTQVLTRALRPVFVRPQIDAQSGKVAPAPVPPRGWRPRLSALSDEAAAQFDNQSKVHGAEPVGPKLLGALPKSQADASATADPGAARAPQGPLLLKTIEPGPETTAQEALSGDALDEALEARERQRQPPLVDQQELAQSGPAEPLRVATRSPEQTPAKPDENDAPSAVDDKQAERLPPLSRGQQALRDKVRRVLKYYYDNPLHSGNRGPWEVMHQMLAFEVHSQIRQHGPGGEPITAVGWLCFNQPCRERTLLYLNKDGELRVRTGPALQGHEGQLLALLAQARVKSTYPIRVEGKQFTIADLVEVEKRTCYPRTELTFKLIGLQNYLDIDDRWVNDQGMQWDFATLVREEMRQPVRTAACGGTHRLSGLTFAYKKFEKSGRPASGEFAAAKRFIANYQNYAYRLQNSDGSFSTEWFRGPGAENDIDRRLKTTGHTLEWLLYAAEEKHFTYNRTVRAVNYLANLMWANRTRDWEAGPLGHAIHALVLYDRLYFKKYDESDGDSVASGAGSQRR